MIRNAKLTVSDVGVDVDYGDKSIELRHEEIISVKSCDYVDPVRLYLADGTVIEIELESSRFLWRNECRTVNVRRQRFFKIMKKLNGMAFERYWSEWRLGLPMVLTMLFAVPFYLCHYGAFGTPHAWNTGDTVIAVSIIVSTGIGVIWERMARVSWCVHTWPDRGFPSSPTVE